MKIKPGQKFSALISATFCGKTVESRLTFTYKGKKGDSVLATDSRGDLYKLTPEQMATAQICA